MFQNMTKLFGHILFGQTSIYNLTLYIHYNHLETTLLLRKALAAFVCRYLVWDLLSDAMIFRHFKSDFTVQKWPFGATVHFIFLWKAFWHAVSICRAACGFYTNSHSNQDIWWLELEQWQDVNCFYTLWQKGLICLREL